MKFILVTFGSSGDINPFIYVGSTLQKRGHSVIVITNEFFKEKIESAGLKFYQAGTKKDFEWLSNSPELFHPTKAFAFVAENVILKWMKPTYQAIEEIYDKESVIIAQSVAFGARIAHEKLGIPLITLNLQPVSFWSLEKPPVFSGLSISDKTPGWLSKLILNSINKFVIDRQFAPKVNSLLEELALPKVKNIFSHWMYSPQLVIGLFPEWFASPASDWAVNTKLTGFISEIPKENLSDELLKFLNDGTAPVVITAGSAMQHGQQFFQTAIAACQKLNLRAVLITNDKQLLSANLGGDYFACQYAPFNLLFPKSLAIIHHGGIGTVVSAIAAAKPQLVTPFAHDQPDNAHRIEKLGLGFKINPKNFKENIAINKLESLLNSSSIKKNCESYSKKMKLELSLDELLKQIETFRV